MRRAMEEHEAHRLRVIDKAAIATRGTGGHTPESAFTLPTAGESSAVSLSPGEVLMRAEQDCALARERADALRECMSHLAKAADIATKQQSEPG